MKNMFLLLFCIFFFSLDFNAQTIPDTLRAKLNAVEGMERLEVWRDWYKDFVASNQDPWVHAIDPACQDAYSILDRDSAMFWCFRTKKILMNKLNYGEDKMLSFTMLKAEKPLVDSLAAANGGKHILRAEWEHQLAEYYYSVDNEQEAVPAFENALRMYHDFGRYDKDFGIYSSIGTLYAWTEGYDNEAIQAFATADSIAKVDSTVTFTNKIWLKYLTGLFHKAKNRLQEAEPYFDQVFPHLDSLGSTRADRALMDYLDLQCRLGNTDYALKEFEPLLRRLMQEGGVNKLQAIRLAASCLLLAGELEEGRKFYEGYTNLMENDMRARHDQALLEMQTQMKTQEKEAIIKELELDKASFRFQLALVGLIGLFGVGVLAFLLYRNKNRRRQVELQRDRDRQIAENRDRLFSSITHDIRTPLALMMAPLERVEKKISDQVIMADVQLAQRNGTRLMELFNQILDWNKAEAKAMRLNNQVGHLHMTIESLCSRFAQLASEQKVIFKHELDVPEGQFSIDYDKLDKILSNLIGNAIKFCNQGQKVELKVALENDKQIQLTVSDNGPGISEEDQANLFNRFYQGAQGRLKGGTGIGMALVHELVNIMKGGIRLESEVGKGTTFYIQLPIQPVADMAVTDLAPIGEEAYQEQPSDASKPLVLVVEDEPELLEFLNSALKGKYEVEKAASATVGQNLAISRIPDIIISDWTLPDHTGGWLTSELRKNPLTSHIPVIILTAHTTDTHQQAAFDAGAVAWMNKPFKLDTLHRQLKTILDQQVRAQLKWSKRNLADNATDEEQAPMDPFLKEVMGQVEANFSDEYYGVEKMAEQLHLSRAQLYRKVKSLTGDGPSKLLTTYRLETAKRLLAQAGQTVAEAAFAVGFSDPNYFSRVYKKHFQVAPTQHQG